MKAVGVLRAKHRQHLARKKKTAYGAKFEAWQTIRSIFLLFSTLLPSQLTVRNQSHFFVLGGALIEYHTQEMC